ncbi:MAG: hypothetical protein HY247_01710 [archaeon]|nr:MAG: hypothetical protein HY247_01710 [archaeon]
MPDVIQIIRTNAAYLFLAAAVGWVGLAIYASSALISWPVFTMAVGGILLRVRPGDRLTWAWAASSAFLGFLVSSYKVYASSQLLFGPFSTVSAVSVGGFAVFALYHLVLLYSGTATGKASKSD